MVRPLVIGFSSCLFPKDPKRPIFKNKSLLYLEESMAHWLLESDILAYMIPTVPDGFSLQRFMGTIDGLVLQGGTDVCPEGYGEKPIKPEWNGDKIRDAYEIELVRWAVQAGKPVLGICRGLQLINVAFGGKLFQDIAHQCSSAQVHRDWDLYESLHHPLHLAPEGRLSQLYGSNHRFQVNSIHHQAIKALAPDFTVEAWADDGIIEAISRVRSDSYILAVQWHPEFQSPNDGLLPPSPLLHDFLKAVRKKATTR